MRNLNVVEVNISALCWPFRICWVGWLVFDVELGDRK
jgi:hypothetical protein